MREILLLVIAVCAFFNSSACNFTAADNAQSDTYHLSAICSSPYNNVTITLEEGDILIFDEANVSVVNLIIQFNGDNISVQVPNTLSVASSISFTGYGSGTLDVDGGLNVAGSWSNSGVDLDLNGSGAVNVAGAMHVSAGTDCSGPCPTFDLSGPCADGGSDYCETHVNCGASCDQPLPITLLSFTAQWNSPLVSLKWTTAMEINNDFFSIEASGDGKEFYPVKNIGGAGNSNQPINYREELAPEPWPVTYYRLKQTDFDGTYSYSKVVSVSRKDEGIVVYPNPASQGDFTLKIKVDEDTHIWLYNALGQEVYQQVFTARALAYWLEKPMSLAKYGQGTYLLRIRQGKNMIHKKVVY
ncbi:T9SS type A sorting domain-containing protein [Rapidithrix thailandica]|uniref:T9SS type A sorting domain-containing protein n=1 Tax=Rapidithrix thailandica TaxID=413964 RepID=A0AAW9SGU0_9BACT